MGLRRLGGLEDMNAAMVTRVYATGPDGRKLDCVTITVTLTLGNG